MPDVERKKVLLVGWDAADWKVIHPLMDRGLMPHVKRLTEQGVMGEIGTLHPVLSPMLWTSIATGKRPFKHGVLGFMEPTPDGLHVQPVTNLSRRTKAIWNILNQNGKRSIVVGWWPSHPAEPIDAVMVSNHYHQSHTLDLETPWKMRPGTIHPPELAKELAELRMHPAEITEELVLPFIPRAAEVNQDKDRRLWMFAKTLAECTSIHGAATHLMETQDWDLMAVYYDAIDHFSHGFMRYHPPRMEHISEWEFDVFQHVVQGAYVYHDMMLGRLLELAGDDATVMLLSDHGFHPDHLRPAGVPFEPTGPAIEHRYFGVFVLKGGGIKRDELIHGVSLLDIAPTVLSMFGLPVGEDMDGRVITEAFETDPEVGTVPSWDEIPGDDGRHPPERQLDANESRAALQQLVELGYVEPLDDDQAKNVERAVNEMNYNLARSYMDAQRYGDAVKLLYDLFTQHPAQYRFGVQLALCFKALGRTDDLDRLVALLEQQRIADARRAHAELQKYKDVAEARRARRDGASPDDGGGKDDAGSLGDDDVFSREERMKIGQLIGLSKVNLYALEFLRGYSNVAKGNYEEGIAQLEHAAAAAPNRPGLQIQLGDTYLKLREWDRAQKAFETALAMDDGNPQTLLGVARCHLGRKENVEAIEWGLRSVGQAFFNPMAHYYIGVALHRIGKIEQAVDALKLSIAQNPNNVRAHGRLGYIYKMSLNDRDDARKQFALAGKARRASQKLATKARSLYLPAFDEANDEAVRALAVDGNGAADGTGGGLLPTIAQTGRDRDEDGKGEARGPFVTIVTGLPRTGTSMMMQMLASGGMEVLSDGRREADEDNPRGYLELEQAKQLATDNRWVERGQGKVVKVVAQLLAYLPRRLDYRVIFMDRAIEEILQSQRVMLSRRGASGADIAEDRLRDVFHAQVREAVSMLRRAGIPVLRAPYAEAVAEPRAFAERVRSFLDVDLDVDGMAAAVDPALHRQKKHRITSGHERG